MSIVVEGIHKTFGSHHVLKGIDFAFETGKINMIIGASGSGKTVLLKCMVGLLTPEEGRVSFDGIDIHRLPYRQMRELRKQIGMLFQGGALFDSQTVAENVAFPLRMFTQLKEREIRDRVQLSLERVNLPKAGALYPGEISGGMKKRVGIARALVLGPRYLFCDEPNSGLDPETAEVIDQLIRRLTDELGITTVVVSHDMKSVLSIGDHILFVFQGHRQWVGTREEVSSAEDPYLQKFIEISGVIDVFASKPSGYNRSLPTGPIERRR